MDNGVPRIEDWPSIFSSSHIVTEAWPPISILQYVHSTITSGNIQTSLRSIGNNFFQDINFCYSKDMWYIYMYKSKTLDIPIVEIMLTRIFAIIERSVITREISCLIEYSIYTVYDNLYNSRSKWSSNGNRYWTAAITVKEGRRPC